jgi:hypothetical protein
MSDRALVTIELERLRGVLKYQPRKGQFVWLVKRSATVPKGMVAGTLKESGHIQIYCFGKPYYAHRLAYLFMKGIWPPDDVDHKDGVRSNNKWSNLRPATNGQNNWNTRKLYKSNTSGKRGVSWETISQRWKARVTVDGHQIQLGSFRKNKLKEAIAARRAGELKYFGKYAPK